MQIFVVYITTHELRAWEIKYHLNGKINVIYVKEAHERKYYFVLTQIRITLR